jgi:hypothetical protein
MCCPVDRGLQAWVISKQEKTVSKSICNSFHVDSERAHSKNILPLLQAKAIHSQEQEV